MYKYSQQDSMVDSSYVRDFKVDVLRSGSTIDVDLFGDTTNVEIKSGKAQLEYPATMNSGYSDLNQPVAGNATLGLFRTDTGVDLGPLVGKHVVMNVSAFFDASTQFDSKKKTDIVIDVGQLLAGAFWLTGPSVTSGPYMRRVSGVVSGILLGAVSDLWVIKISWAINHLSAINDAYDNFILHFDIHIFGYAATRGVILIDY